MWTYSQINGELLDPTGKILAAGYSGMGLYKNDPTAENVHSEGPIPCGKYTINPPESTVEHGPYVLPLTPDEGNEMFGRAGFLIHGDSLEHPGAASEGCIIMPRAVREAIWQSGNHELQVISGLDNAEDVQDAINGEK